MLSVGIELKGGNVKEGWTNPDGFDVIQGVRQLWTR